MSPPLKVVEKTYFSHFFGRGDIIVPALGHTVMQNRKKSLEIDFSEIDILEVTMVESCSEKAKAFDHMYFYLY